MAIGPPYLVPPVGKSPFPVARTTRAWRLVGPPLLTASRDTSTCRRPTLAASGPAGRCQSRPVSGERPI
ncbi:hypothetical protein KPB2_5518 [Klebsiella pneumoniae Kb677]|nr:hypothetical protein KPB2_5518 [Klebsiella pneumoniae Kb677]